MPKNNDGQSPINERILVQDMNEVMHDAMLPYAEHVILERALPRLEDGLKPVQRRILYTMLELGLTPDKPYRKSAKVVGDCLAKFHPHGDSSVYDAMVRMAQDFNMRLPLIDGHGNFGSMDGDSAAAMRYTEARMAPAALELLRDIDKDTVKFSLNFDDSIKEPDVLPGRFPNLLINGANGIAVGLTTSIPPHNPGEAIDAVIAKIENPDISLVDLMKIIPCPDFPTGGYLLKSDEIYSAYETGRGKLINRAKTHIETLKNGKKNIVITEFPYQVNKASALEKILSLVQEKKTIFGGISDIRDESDRMGVRAVIELRKDIDENRILNALYKYSELQKTVSVIMVAISEGKPVLLGLNELIEHYIRHQEDVVSRRCKCELDQAERRQHVLEGLMIALLNIDEVIALIRASKSPKTAKAALIKRFELSPLQADAILELRLQRLTNLEQLAIEQEAADLKKKINKLSAILNSKEKLDRLIKDELLEIRKKFDSPRRTLLIDAQDDDGSDLAALDKAEPASVLILKDNRIRRIPPKYMGEELILKDAPVSVYNTTTDEYIRLFTNHGACLSLRVSDIPELKPSAKPTNLSALVQLNDSERVVSAFCSMDASDVLTFITEKGMVKTSPCSEYMTRSKRIAAINLKDSDALLNVICVPRDCDNLLLLVTRGGMSIRFGFKSLPVTGRVSAGVCGIKLSDDDSVVYAAPTDDEGELLCVTDRGYMKRSFMFDFEEQGRNGKGLQCFGFKKNGSNGTQIAYALYVKTPKDITVVQKNGELTELNSDEVQIEPRTGKGQLFVMVLMDNIVVDAFERPSGH